MTEVLMLEMKMAPAAKAYLISGYPRSMRDVVEYSEKVITTNDWLSPIPINKKAFIEFLMKTFLKSVLFIFF